MTIYQPRQKGFGAIGPYLPPVEGQEFGGTYDLDLLSATEAMRALWLLGKWDYDPYAIEGYHIEQQWGADLQVAYSLWAQTQDLDGDLRVATREECGTSWVEEAPAGWAVVKRATAAALYDAASAQGDMALPGIRLPANIPERGGAIQDAYIRESEVPVGLIVAGGLIVFGIAWVLTQSRK